MQDQPVVRVAPEGLGNQLFELGFDCVRGLVWSKAGAVADPEDVSVDGECFVAPGGVENDIGGLAPDAGQGFELFARARDLATVIVDQRLAECDDVLGLGVEQADRLDRVAQRIFAKLDHLLRCLHLGEDGPAGDIHADVGRLSGKNHGDEQRVWVGIFEFGRRRRIGFGEPPEEFEHLPPVHRLPITSCIE